MVARNFITVPGEAFNASGAGAVERTVDDKLRDIVSVKDFGAVGDGVTDDTAAIQAAATAAGVAQKIIFFPAGTYLSGKVNFPANCKGLIGSGPSSTIQAAGAITAFDAFFYFNAPSNLLVKDLTINVNTTTYPTITSLYVGDAAAGIIQNVRFVAAGNVALYLPGCENFTVKNVQVDSVLGKALFAEGPGISNLPQNLTVDGLVSLNNAGSHHIAISGGSHHKVTNCYVYTQALGNFGISVSDATDTLVSGNTCVTNTTEGINLQDCLRSSVSNNTVYCLSGHADFGISLYGATSAVRFCIVNGNRVYGAGKAGIAIASNAATALASNNVVEANLIQNCNQLNEAQWGGVTLYGGSSCTNNVVQNNVCLDEGSNMKYGANEWDDGNGAPVFNYLLSNTARGSGLLAQQNPLGTTTLSKNIDAVAFTPSVTASSGTITTATATGSYLIVGKYAHVNITATITDNGTGAGSLIINGPNLGVMTGCLNGRENSLTGKQVNGLAATNSFVIRDYANGYPGGTGASIVLSGIVKLA